MEVAQALPRRGGDVGTLGPMEDDLVAHRTTRDSVFRNWVKIDGYLRVVQHTDASSVRCRAFR
jgi:hypothetical protein